MTDAPRDLLEQHFEIAFAAPDGIKKLRELILTLAMQGKLVEQDPTDQPASELVKEIESEKQRLAKAGGVRIPKPLPQITEQEMTHEIPESWVWVRFGGIAQHNSGKTLDKGRNTGQPRDYITTSNLYWGRFELDNVRQMLIRDDELEKCTAKKDDLLICEGGEAGRAAVWHFDTEVCFQNHVHRARFYKSIDPYFAQRFFEKLNATGEIDQYRKGVGISNMSSKALASIAFPLPPISEQHRIVARIGQLMARCDALETLRKERKEKRQAVHAAAIQQLLEVKDGAAWGFVEQHFGDLYSVKENVSELRKAILQLAVVGKLVPQDPNDQPTSDLLKEIAEKKQQLVKNKLLKIGQNTEDTKFICHDVVIPKTWKWVKGSEILFVTKLAGFEFTKYIHLQDEGEVPVIRAQNVRQFHVDLRNLKFIDLKTSQILDRCALTKPSLLVTFIGAGIGDVALFDLPERWHLAPNVAKMEPFVGCEKGLNLRYLNYFLLSPLGRREIFKHLKSTAQPSISMGTIRDIDYPLPPVAEQHRIVEKIDRLMTMCDTLEQTIGAALWKKTEMLDAMMAQV